MNLNEVIEQEQLERDRRKLINKGSNIDDIKWEFITDLILQSKDKTISKHDMDLIYEYTEKIKKEMRL